MSYCSVIYCHDITTFNIALLQCERSRTNELFCSLVIYCFIAWWYSNRWYWFSGRVRLHSRYTAAIEINQMGPLMPCKIEREYCPGETFLVFCQHKGVSSGLTCKNKENHFFLFFWPFHLFSSVSPFLETTKWALYLRNAIYVVSDHMAAVVANIRE